MKNSMTSALALLFVMLTVPVVHADSLFGEFKRLPDEIEKGFYIGADVGFSFLRGDVGGNLAGQTAENPGSQLTFVIGHDIGKYLSLETASTVLIHKADSNDAILQGGVNMFLFDLGVKFQLPVRRWNPFLFIGGGVAVTRPDYAVDENNKLTMMFAGGIEYYTMLRHYSLYAKVAYHYIDLPVDDLSISFGMRYTF